MDVFLSGLAAGPPGLGEETESYEGAERKMKQSNSMLSGKPALFWLQPLAGRMCWVHRERRSRARSSWGEPRAEIQDSLPPTRVHWRKVTLK